MRNSDSTQVVRLDVALLERGLTDSRSKAQRLIADGKVSVNGVTVTKASAKVGGDDVIAADRGDGYVSRGAYKLVGAFERFADVGLRSAQGLRCLDIGASTGGFCDVLLRNDAAQVIALDVGHGQLDPKIAHDDRIIEMSGVNIRDVYAEDLPYRPEMIVSDVSFISLTYVIPVIARIAAPQAQIVLLVKPQFEVGKGNLGKARNYANRRCPPSWHARNATGLTCAPQQYLPLKARMAISNICCTRSCSETATG